MQPRTASEFLEFATQYLAERDLLDQPGALLYSAGRTVTKGKLLILGYNPGGSEENTVGSTLGRFDSEWNCYLDEEWAPGGIARGEGQAPFQAGLNALVAACGHDLRNVCGTNVVFLRSTRVGKLQNPIEAEDVCWPVIQALLNIVRPETIICLGRHAQAALRRRSSKFDLLSSIHANHANWRFEAHAALFGDVETKVIMTPHPGVYNVKARAGADILRWVAGEPVEEELECQTEQRLT